MRWSPLLFCFLTPGLAWCWPPNGVRLTGAPFAQVTPRITSDGSGGAFVAWVDQRDLPIDRSDCYLQHVTANGAIAPGWPPDGLPVVSAPGNRAPAALLADGDGGVLVAFGDARADPSGDLYLQRITATGTVAPGWPSTGVPIAVVPGEQAVPVMVTDGAGGAFVSWQDGLDLPDSRARYTHVLSSGEIAPGWPSGGRLFEPTSEFVLRPLMLATPDGGFLACWSVSEDALATARMLAQRFTADGTPDPAWPAGGITACEPQPNHRVPRERLVTDGAGGFYTVFADGRESGAVAEDLYAQHVLGNGTIAPGWPADALPVSALPGVIEQDASLCEDGRGGVFFVWEDYRLGAASVFGQHLQADGQPHAGWPAMGRSLTGSPGFQLSPELAWDGRDGAYMTWNNLQPGGYRSYVQHLTPSGAPAIGWPVNGLPVIPLPTDQYVPTITADGLGGAIVAWEDIRDGETDVYAQRFVTDGVVATRVSLAGAEATPEEVRIRWQVSGETRASVERREGDGVWRALIDLTADGTGLMSLVDRDVRPGERYGYRLALPSGARGGETSVVVPASLVLALEGARPNPAVGAVWLAFTLTDASAARLELFDLAGRQVASREVGARGAGQHIVRLDDGGLAPGLYWVSLSHGGRTLRTRVALTR